MEYSISSRLQACGFGTIRVRLNPSAEASQGEQGITHSWRCGGGIRDSSLQPNGPQSRFLGSATAPNDNGRWCRDSGWHKDASGPRRFWPGGGVNGQRRSLACLIDRCSSPVPVLVALPVVRSIFFSVLRWLINGNRYTCRHVLVFAATL